MGFDGVGCAVFICGALSIIHMWERMVSGEGLNDIIIPCGRMSAKQIGFSAVRRILDYTRNSGSGNWREELVTGNSETN